MTEEFPDTHIVTFKNGKRREIKIVRKSERHYNVYYLDKLVGMAQSVKLINEMIQKGVFGEMLDKMDREQENIS